MRVLPAVAIVLVALLPVTACAGRTDDSAGPAAEVTVPPNNPGAGQGGDGEGDVLELGRSAQTVGNRLGGGGELEITPLSVVYASDAAGVASDNGVFAVIVVRDRNTGQVPTQESTPTEGGGWQWITPEGQRIEEGNGAALNVQIGDYQTTAQIQPGAFELLTTVFDIKQGQRRGTLVYLDGEERSHRWRTPLKDAGPQAAAVRRDLAS